MNSSDAHLPVRLWSEALTRGVLSAVWGVKVTGIELVPRVGSLIVACNHVSLIDPVLLYATIGPVRRPYGLGKKELFENPAMNWFFRSGGTIPLDRKGDASTAMRAALDVLKQGGCLSIFPEGTRVKPGEKRPPKPGVAFLSVRSGAPVLPIHVLGTADFPWCFPLEVRFGAPMEPPKSDDRETGLAYARAVMNAVYSL